MGFAPERNFVLDSALGLSGTSEHAPDQGWVCQYGARARERGEGNREKGKGGASMHKNKRGILRSAIKDWNCPGVTGGLGTCGPVDLGPRGKGSAHATCKKHLLAPSPTEPGKRRG